MKALSHRLLAPWLRTEELPFIDRIVSKTANDHRVSALLLNDDYDSDAVLEHEAGHLEEEIFTDWKDTMGVEVWNVLQSLVQQERRVLFEPNVSIEDKKCFKTKEEINREMENEVCDGTHECNAVRRVIAILRVYHELKDSKFWVCFVLMVEITWYVSFAPRVERHCLTLKKFCLSSHFQSFCHFMSSNTCTWIPQTERSSNSTVGIIP